MAKTPTPGRVKTRLCPPCEPEHAAAIARACLTDTFAAARACGADRVVLVDACTSGGEPGSIYRMRGEDVEQLPPLDGINLHSFRWDHALAFGRWVLKDDYPTDIVVYLIEAASFGFGDPLSELVEAAVDELVDHLLTAPADSTAAGTGS